MRKTLLLSVLLLLPVLVSRAEGRRTQAGETFLEQLTPRDSVLVADWVRYGFVCKDVAEGTSFQLPVMEPEQGSPLMIVSGGWQLDSVRVSRRKETPVRYDIRASLVLTAFMGGTYELPPLTAVVGGDTLVYRPQTLEVTEPVIDMETFEPHDIKGQVKFPYTFTELFPYIYGGVMGLMALAALLLWLITRKKAAGEQQAAEPAHIRALRRLDKFRGNQYWQPEKQKAFYSGVTDALREYIVSRYGVGAMEMTTAEIFADLKDSDIPADLYEEMKDLFERADFVKFAKFTATDEDNAKVLPSAVRFVSTTYQQEIEVGSSHPSGVRDDKDNPGEADSTVIPSEASVSHETKEKEA